VAGKAVQVMDSGRQEAGKSVENANETDSALGSIAEAVDNINQMNIQIATASEEQSLVAEEMNRNILNVKDMTVQTVQGADQTADLAMQLATMSDQLRGLSSSFKA